MSEKNKMTITQALNELLSKVGSIKSHDYYSASSGINIPMVLVTPKFTKTDSMGNEIFPGGIVAFTTTGKSPGSQVGILLGFTEQGYRVLPFNTRRNNPEWRTLTRGINTPYDVWLVKSKGSAIR